MKNKELINTVTRSVNRFGLKMKKHTPEILVVTGVVGVVTSTVMACRATTKLDAVIENAKFEVNAVHAAKEKGEVKITNPDTDKVEVVEYTDEDHKQDLARVYIRNGLKVAKLYGPSVAVGVASITCILASVNMMHKRNVALSAAFAALNTDFKEYRERLTERLGNEFDRELRFDIKAKEVDEIVTDENGEETTVKTIVNVPTIAQYSEYARCFDETCINWERSATHNKAWLISVQNAMNDLLRTRGHVFLNEVYDALGFMRTKAGNIVGWVYDKEHPIGDNAIDFGIWNLNCEANRRFVNGYEKSIWLDFNVDGEILDLIQ